MLTGHRSFAAKYATGTKYPGATHGEGNSAEGILGFSDRSIDLLFVTDVRAPENDLFTEFGSSSLTLFFIDVE